MQGEAHLLSDGTSQVILVEHETGLEILYIAGSLASLVSIVPMVLQGWRAIRGLLGDRNRQDVDRNSRKVEIRRLDADGHLMEKDDPDLRSIFAAPVGVFHMAQAAQNGLFEHHFRAIVDEIHALMSRVEILERQLTTFDKPRRRPSAPKKRSIGKTLKKKPRKKE